MSIEKVIRFGKETLEDRKMDKIRMWNCMCLNCSYMEKCPTAKKLYQICVEDNMAMMITRCGVKREGDFAYKQRVRK